MLLKNCLVCSYKSINSKQLKEKTFVRSLSSESLQMEASNFTESNLCYAWFCADFSESFRAAFLIFNLTLGGRWKAASVHPSDHPGIFLELNHQFLTYFGKIWLQKNRSKSSRPIRMLDVNQIYLYDTNPWKLKVDWKYFGRTFSKIDVTTMIKRY